MAEGPSDTTIPRRDPGLIVVLSSERSGSTLLRVMLGEHSRVYAPSELFLLRYADYDTWRAEKPVAMLSVLDFFRQIGRPTTADAVDRACAGRSTLECYRWLLGFLAPGTFLVDKTPAYANDLATLLRAEALQPFYVWLIRHPLGVIESHLRLDERRRRRRGRGWHALGGWLLTGINRLQHRLTGEMSPLAREREVKWVLQNANVRHFLEQVPRGRRHVVRFEQLVREPAATLAELCAAIGIALEPAMARPETRTRRMHPELGDVNFHRHDGIDPEVVERWRARYHERRLRYDTVRLMREVGLAPRREPESARPPRLVPTLGAPVGSTR